MKQLFLLLLLFNVSVFLGQDLYDTNTIQDIRIVFAESNWDEILDAAEPSNEYVEALSVSVNGTVYNTVGVKFKGNSSYDPNFDKNPFHIELDTYVDQNHQGYTDIKLNNVIFDPSFVRETVSYDIIGKYMHAPLSNYANLYVNDVLIGLYTNVESVSKKFVSSRFGSNDNAFFNCSPPDGAGPSSTNLPSLVYLGTNSADYEDAYEMKSDEGWDDLIELTNILNNDIANIETVLDIDRAIWMLALDNVMVNIDSYIGQFNQNYYLYKNDSGLFNAIKWDLNMSFGVFAMTGAGPPLNTTAQKRQLSHTLHDSDSDWPLINELLAIPTYKKKYLAHYKTILEENFSNNSYYATAQAYQALISASVTADPNKFYTTAEFTSNMSTDVGVGMLTAPGLSNLMPGRATYLSALSDFSATQPSIANITTSEPNPNLGTDVVITASVTNTNTDAVYLGYRTSRLVPFTKVTLYDDGAHDDGAAGDNVYGNSMPIDAVITQYYIYAENNTIGRFSPERAEHEYYSITATYEIINAGDITINELLAKNTIGETDEMGEYEDWVELYNTTSGDLDLAGHYLSDDTTEVTKWQFPTNSIIPANGYMIIWADNDASDGPLHATWKLSAGGESVTLSTPTEDLIDEVIFPELADDMAYARNPNGTGDFVIQAPTFYANNETLAVDDLSFEHYLTLYPNPTNSLLTVQNSSFPVETVEIFDMLGQKLYANMFDNQNNVTVDLSSFSEGLYVVVVNKTTNLKIVKE